MNKLRMLFALLFCAVASSSVWAEKVLTHVWDPSVLTEGTQIALQCRDYNGGEGWYLNGAAKKSETFSEAANIYILESAGTGFYLKRVSDGKYIGGTVNNGAAIADATAQSAAVAFTFGVPDQIDNWTTKNRDLQTDPDKTLRLTTVTNTGQFLNTNDKNSKPKYAGGKGGYSIWYVYTWAEETAVPAVVDGKVVDLRQLSNSKAYFLNTARGNLYYDANYPGYTSAVGKYEGVTADQSNANHQWAIIQAEGHYYFYNIGAQMFGSRNGAELVLTKYPATDDMIFTDANGNENYPWTIKEGGNYVNVSHGCIHGIAFDTWGGNGKWDEGNQYTIKEIEDADNSVAEARVAKWNDTDKTTLANLKAAYNTIGSVVGGKVATAEQLAAIATDIENLDLDAAQAKMDALTATVALSSAKIYAIRNANDPSLHLYVNDSQKIGANGSYNATNKNYQWVVFDNGDGTYSVVNIGKKALMNNTTNNTSQGNHWNVVDYDGTDYDGYKMTVANVEGSTAKFLFRDPQYDGGSSYLHYNSGYATGITNWGSGAAASHWQIVEVGELPTEAQGTLDNLFDWLIPGRAARNELKSLIASADAALLSEAYTSTTNLITSANQLASNAGQNEIGNKTDGGGIPALVNGVTGSTDYFHSSWDGTNANTGGHFLQIDFQEADLDYIKLMWWKRNNDHPKTIDIWGTNEAAAAALDSEYPYTTIDYNQSSWTEGWGHLATLTVENTDPVEISTVPINHYRYIRIKVLATHTKANGDFFSMSELKAFKQDADLAAALLHAKTVLNSGSEDATVYENEVEALKSVLAQPLRVALQALLDAEAPQTGGIGYYTVASAEAVNAAKAAGEAVKNSSNVDVLQGAITAIEEAIAALEVQAPTTGFYRIKGGTSEKYMASTTTSGRMNLQDLDSDNSRHTIWYLTDDNKFVSYVNGQGIKDTHTLADAGEDINAWTFEAAEQGVPYLNLKSNASKGGQYLCDWTDNVANRMSAASSERTHWLVEPVNSLPVAIGATGYATLNLPVATTIPAGVEAWYASSDAADGIIRLTKIEGTLPANCAVILHSETPATYDFAITTGGTTVENKFQGTIAAQAKPTEGITLVLGQKEGEIGLYKYTADNLPGFKLYYHSAEVASVRLQFLDCETAIEAAHSDLQQDKVYNLRGQQVQKMQHGIYIVNGKKILVNK